MNVHSNGGPLPEDWSGEPRFAIFFVPSPCPIALPHGATFCFVRDESVDWLKGVPLRPAPGMSSTPPDSDGRNFVSIRVWRVEEELTFDDEPLNRAMRIARTVLGETHDPKRSLSRAGDGESYATIFECVTCLLPRDPRGQDHQAAVDDAFDRSLDTLTELIRAYEIVSKDPRCRLPSRATVFPFIPWTSRHPDGWDWGSVGLLIVNATSRFFPVPTAVLSDNDVEAIMTVVSRMRRDDPIPVATNWARAGNRSFWFEGDYPASIVQIHVASEVFLDTVLLFLAWEKGTPPEDVADWFEEGLGKRVRTYYSPRLGGNWDTTDETCTVGLWSKHVREVRNRIVHRGYWPTEEEAIRCIRARDELESFVKGRLAARANKYPRSALLVLGLPGLKRLNALGRKMKQFIDTQAPEEPDWLKSYSTWVETVDSGRRPGP